MTEEGASSDEPPVEGTPAPTVFVAYSHDSSEHKMWVARLATDLRRNGIEAILDSIPQAASIFTVRLRTSDYAVTGPASFEDTPGSIDN